MLDSFGTPYTERLHLVERYRLLDYDATKEAVERASKELFQFTQNIPPDNGPRADFNYKGKGLQIQLTVEDEGAFTSAWSATLTFRRALASDQWLELVCSDNRHEYYYDKDSDVPRADNLDF
jgi:hypothetical protein